MSFEFKASSLMALLAGGLVLSCGSPERSPIAAYSITIGAGSGCLWAGAGGNVPEGQELRTAASSLDAPMRAAADYCTVKGDQTTGLTVSGKVSFQATSTQSTQVLTFKTVSPITLSTGGTATLGFVQIPQLPQGGISSPAAEPCTATIIEWVEGAVYLNVNCTALTDPFTPGSSCAARNTRIILDGCDY